MICQKCGFENTPGDKFCSKCQNVLDFRALDSQMININDLELVKETQDLNREQVEASIPKSRSYKKLLILFVILILAAGLIAVVALPVYDTYIKAEIIKEVVSATRIKVERYAREHRSWPLSASDIKANIPARAKGKISMEVNNGAIELVISDVPGKKARFTPSVNDRGYIVWKCHHGGISQDYLPTMCFKGN